MPRSDGKCEIKKVREIRSDYLIFSASTIVLLLEGLISEGADELRL